ncbi:MAG TPA: ROK family transcriptional regulator [Anaerolineae bacterium]|nr:ROK family transcriptional regulator [Anaerolineae bacterium]HQI83290.1 ROK family transcriptional regulator [Anaerolineae bacterium]
MTKKATHEQTRIHNTQLVFSTVYERGEISRAEIARITRLTRPTVSDVVADLMVQGLLEEIGRAPSTGGKRAILLRVNADSRCLIGIDLAREDFRGALINLNGEIKHRVSLPLQGRNGTAALELVYELVDTLIQAACSPLLGIGIGTPGLVDAVNGVIYQAVNLNWRDVHLRTLLQQRYHLPVYMANDCQVAALGEYTFGENSSTRDLVVIHVGKGVGAGIVLNGRLFHGNPLGAGEIGHVTVVENGERCQCGNTGCLETVANSRGIVRQAQALAKNTPESILNQLVPHPDALTFETVCEAFAEGDAAAQQVIRNVGQHLGAAAASLVGVLGGCRILLSGRITCFGEFLLNTVREEMNKRALASLSQTSEIGFVSMGADIILLGAAALLLHEELGLFPFNG